MLNSTKLVTVFKVNRYQVKNSYQREKIHGSRGQLFRGVCFVEVWYEESYCICKSFIIYLYIYLNTTHTYTINLGVLFTFTYLIVSLSGAILAQANLSGPPFLSRITIDLPIAETVPSARKQQLKLE